MIANQTKIKFNQSGDSFFTNETLEILPNRFNILYGRNGSGKTSISQAISMYRDSLETEESQIEFVEPLAEEDKKHIFVYDEKYIEKNIKVEQDGLNQIVMLGEQVELDQHIKKCEERIEKILNEKTILEDSLDRKNPLSIAGKFDTVSKKLNTELTAAGNWAERDGKIKGNKINSKVVSDTILEIYNSGKGTMPLPELAKEVEQGMSRVIQTKGRQRIQWTCPKFSKPIDFEELNNKLSKKIELPELSERDKAILRIIEGKYGHYISKTEEVFNNKDVEVCPLCLRPIESEEKETAIQLVQRILNKEAQNYMDQLNNEIAKLTEIQLSIIPNNESGLFNDEIKRAQAAIHAYNSIIKEVKDIVKERLENIYQHFSKNLDEERYDNSLNELKAAFGSIDACVKEYNRIIGAQEAFKNEIILKNKQLAFNEFESHIREYVALTTEKSRIKEELNGKKGEEERERISLKELLAQKQQVTIALRFINQALSYVFFDKNRLQLKKGDGCYTLCSRKKEVKPTKISIGERNIIALCYFFATMFVNKEEKDKYKEASLIIIDDPVSSFDFENRVGVVSLLRWMAEQFLKGNENTKILIMTHDLQTVFDLQKVREELENNKDGYIELIDKKISPQNGLHNEYKNLIVSVFEFACGNHEEQSSTIGNQMRKLMVAYSSFIYARNFMSIVHDDEVIGNIQGDKQLYYKNLMTRLVLNGESHELEAANAIDLTGFKFTREEKLVVAKSIIMFLYYINPKHVTSYLSKEAVGVINQWKDEGFDVLND